jgi:Cu(I)/Ag(I) efflux system membrane protein CusA/SilA
MLSRIIQWSGRNPFLVLLATLFVVLGGVVAVMKTPLDALPDLSDVQVIVYTEYPGQAPQVVEDQVTYPLTTAMLAVPKSKVVRGFSFFGASFVYVIFEDGTDIYWARSRVLEYLNFASSRLPKGVSPALGPDATGVGWVYQYALLAKNKTWPSCARSRTGTCATSSPRRPAWPRSRRWAASCRPTRSPSTRSSCAASASR